MPTSSDRSPRILLNAEGFSVVGQEGDSHHIEWASLKEIFAFKLDLWSFDTIRLGFRVSDDGTYWEVDENWPGYRDLLEEIERRLEIVDPDWWQQVAFPAFSTNRTTLWGESPDAR
jgi:hypothetical protein